MFIELYEKYQHERTYLYTSCAQNVYNLMSIGSITQK